MAQKIHFRFSRDFKRNLWKTPKYEESFGEVSRFALLSQKNGFVFVDQLLHFWALPWLLPCTMGDSDVRRNFLESFKVCLALPEKCFGSVD